MSIKISINYRAVILFLLYIFIILGDVNPVFAYTDEIATIVFMGCIGYSWFLGRLETDDKKIVSLLFSITILGIISNLLSGIKVSIFVILVDVLWLFKIYSGYLSIKYFLRTERAMRNFITYVSFFSKILIIIAFFGALLNFVVDIGLSDGTVRYGWRAYSFLMKNSGHFGMIVASALAFIIMDSKPKSKTLLLYYLMAFFEIFATTKLMPILVIVVIVLLKHQQCKKKIKLKYFFFLAIAVLFVGRHQIIHYICDLNHPRMRLIIYGIKTALMYFPFGSGFATYGSEMARRYYSPLYTYWGFADYYGLSPVNDSCLNDNYMAMIIAQGGVISFILFLVIMYIIFRKTIKRTDLRSSNIRNMLVALYVSMLATSVMSGTFKGAIGMLTFMTIGVLSTRTNKAEEYR